MSRKGYEEKRSLDIRAINSNLHPDNRRLPI